MLILGAILCASQQVELNELQSWQSLRVLQRQRCSPKCRYKWVHGSVLQERVPASSDQLMTTQLARFIWCRLSAFQAYGLPFGHFLS